MRTDLELIADLIQPNSKILEIGCGDGTLLNHLIYQRKIDGRGIEISQDGVGACMKQGLPVVQGDADYDLIHYPDKSFDYVISSKTLQATHNPKKVLKEMLRIGKQVIISIPNFAYWYNRFYLSIKGRMPVSKTLSYEWYETPNIHFCTVHDFIVLCKELECVIENKKFISNDKILSPFFGSKLLCNIYSDLGIFVLRDA
jgi:methionine biosynthesis protein MetW